MIAILCALAAGLPLAIIPAVLWWRALNADDCANRLAYLHDLRGDRPARHRAEVAQ